MNQCIIDSWKKAPKYLNKYESDTSLLYKNVLKMINTTTKYFLSFFQHLIL